MKIIDSSAEVIFHYPLVNNVPTPPQKFIERVGRSCYKSEENITDTSASNFIKKLFDNGHHAMLEHSVATVFFVTDRGVSHELVRHRLASYAQESTRFCNYSRDKFGGEITVIQPSGINNNESLEIWKKSVEQAEAAYMGLLKIGVSPQSARSVLPTCLKTEIYKTANLREWLHVFTLRCSPNAHPDIRLLMKKALPFFAERVPEMFGKLHHEVQKM
jgi:thymidylate synthase (FAD)